MSSLVYGALTGKREEAPLDQSDEAWSTGLSHYVDIFAALVPAEVLAAHALFMELFTDTTKDYDSDLVTHIAVPVTKAGPLKVVFIGLIAATILLYIIGHQRKRWDRLDIARACIPPLAFIGWMLVQKPTALDAFWPDLKDEWRVVSAVFLSLLLPILVKWLAAKADDKESAVAKQAKVRTTSPL